MTNEIFWIRMGFDDGYVFKVYKHLLTVCVLVTS